MVAFSAPVGLRSHCTRRARLLQPLRRNPFLARPMSAIHPSLAEPPRRLESRPSRSVLNPTGCGPTLEVPHPRGTDERRFTSARRAVALAAALALGCRATPAPARGDAHATAPPASAAPQPALPSRLDGAANHGLVAAEPVSAAPIQAAQVVFVQGHELSLSPTPGPCVVSQRAGGARVARRITLALEGPCFFVSWVRPPPPPPGPGSVSDGVPLGAKGDVRAYSYGNGVSVVVVLGNPVAPEDAERARGYTCAGGSQAILLQGSEGRASKRIIESGRVQCVEWGGPDEKEFWLFGHE